ncbi:MAG: hypothetical protein LBI42_03460 [Chitinispirillales bacterium]|jgi:hypothetical protein|nr:hypothetical protein [Chitinispirillales bacterium]
MSSKIKTFGFALVSVMVFNAVSYGQIAFSGVRDVGAQEQVLDHTISLHRSWSELASDSSLRDEYEQTIGYWADAIYEMTNGGHRLGKVRIFPRSKYKGKTDVNWVANLHPSANPGSFMTSNGRINMSDMFSYRIPSNSTTNKRRDWEGAGYVLAHESGHYVYSLYDEYKGDTINNLIYWPQLTDEPVVPSIMNNQWNARGGNYEWLNFSTPDNIGITSETAQGRMHGVDAWTFLTSNRGKYDVLKSRAPSNSDIYNGYRMKIELPSTRARDSLKVIWMSDTIAIDMVLDRSGSMIGTPLRDLKIAAKAFVDIINKFSDTTGLIVTIGITTFSDSTENAYPLTVLNNSTASQIKNIIDNINVQNMTAMYDGVLASGNKLLSASSDVG